MVNEKIRHLFSGSNTCAGFMGFFEELRFRARRTVILKGGPGVGKSTLMKEAGKHFEQMDQPVIYYHCSGDPDSLDAMLAPESGFLMLDGTAPHIIDPRLPGARDCILNLGVCLNEKQLENQQIPLEKLFADISAAYSRAYRYLAAAKSLRNDAAAVYDAAFSKQSRRKLENELSSLAPATPAGNTLHAFAQAITCQGVVQQIDSILTDSVYCLDIPWAFDAHALLLPLLNDAQKEGLASSVYHDPLDAGCLSHLALGPVLFTTAIVPGAPVLSPDLDESLLRREAPRLAFDRAVYDLTLNQAIDALADAKALHDTLERYYIDAMDFARLSAIKQELMETLPRE